MTQQNAPSASAPSLRLTVPADQVDPNSSSAGAFAQEIGSNNMVIGNKNSKALYDQTSVGIYDEMSKGASVTNNKYLEKIAFIKNLTSVDKLKIGLSTTGLGIGSTGLGMNIYDKRGDAGRDATAKKSLAALNKIHAAIQQSQMQKATN